MRGEASEDRSTLFRLAGDLSLYEPCVTCGL